MATTAPSAVVEQEEDITDDQIDALLARASARLQQRTTTHKTTKKRSYKLPKLQTGRLDQPYVSSQDEVTTVDAARLLEPKHRRQANTGVRKVEDPVTAKKRALEKKHSTAGPSWFDLPRTNLTPELKRDLQLLKMRNVLDPHRHYKQEGGAKMQAPMYSQVGTIVEGPTEFFSARIENRKRKRTLVEEVLAGEQETGRFRRKYGEVQERKRSGKKGFYKAVQARRKGGVKKGG